MATNNITKRYIALHVPNSSITVADDPAALRRMLSTRRPIPTDSFTGEEVKEYDHLPLELKDGGYYQCPKWVLGPADEVIMHDVVQSGLCAGVWDEIFPHTTQGQAEALPNPYDR